MAQENGTSLLPTRRALALKLVDLGSGESIASFCKKIGLHRQDYQKIIQDPMMFEEVWDLSFSMLMVPAIPEIVSRWRDKIMSGDIPAMKLLMQYKGKSQPDNHQHVHLHKEVNMLEGDALDKRIAETMGRIESLQKEAM